MSIHNVVHTQVRFKINLPVLNSKKHLERPCDYDDGNQKTKNPKIQSLCEGPETFGFFGFPRVFLVFLGFALKKPWFFLDFCWKTKKTQGFFGFSAGFLAKNQKNLVFFLDFCWKTKKNTRFCWFFCWVSGEKPKKTLFFWISAGKTKKNHGFVETKPKKPKKT